MRSLEAIEHLTSKAIVHTVLVECEAAMGGKSWHVVLVDNHGRKGHGKSNVLEAAMQAAIVHLNENCGGQLRNYLY